MAGDLYSGHALLEMDSCIIRDFEQRILCPIAMRLSGNQREGRVSLSWEFADDGITARSDLDIELADDQRSYVMDISSTYSIDDSALPYDFVQQQYGEMVEYDPDIPQPLFEEESDIDLAEIYQVRQATEYTIVVPESVAIPATARQAIRYSFLDDDGMPIGGQVVFPFEPESREQREQAEAQLTADLEAGWQSDVVFCSAQAESELAALTLYDLNIIFTALRSLGMVNPRTQIVSRRLRQQLGIE